MHPVVREDRTILIVGNPAALFETTKRTPCSLCSASLCEGMHELGVGTISLKARTHLPSAWLLASRPSPSQKSRPELAS